MIYFLIFTVLSIIAMLIRFDIIIKYDEKLTIRLKYLFINIDIYSLIAKVEQKRKQKPQKEKKTSEPKDIWKIHDFLVRGLNKNLEKFKKRIIIKKFNVNIQTGIGDAKDTALVCGHIYNGVYAINSLVINNFKIIENNFSVIPRFNEKCFEFRAEIIISSSILNILMFALLFLINTKKRK